MRWGARIGGVDDGRVPRWRNILSHGGELSLHSGDVCPFSGLIGGSLGGSQTILAPFFGDDEVDNAPLSSASMRAEASFVAATARAAVYFSSSASALREASSDAVGGVPSVEGAKRPSLTSSLRRRVRHGDDHFLGARRAVPFRDDGESRHAGTAPGVVEVNVGDSGLACLAPSDLLIVEGVHILARRLLRRKNAV